MPRKIINVVGAAIIKDGEVLCARRGEGKSLAGYWEFPGGKIELHESARQALHREIEEDCSAKLKSAAKCAPLHMITTSAPSYSQHSYATC